MVITLLHNYEGEVGVDQLNIWANEFGLDHPVLDDGDFSVSEPLWPDDRGRPDSVMLGPGAEVLYRTPTREQVDDVMGG